MRAAASGQLVVPTSTLGALGLRGARASIREARSDLAEGLPSSSARLLGRAAIQVSGAAGRGEQLRSDAFELGSVRAASEVLAAWRRAHRASRVAVGRDGSEAVSRRVALVAWREGARIGVIRLTGPRGFDVGSTALAFARLADSDLRIVPSSTAWGRVVSQVSSGGGVSEGTALQAVALAYGSIPGVGTPSGSGGVALSGDLAAGWIGPYLNRLPARQRKVVEQRLGVSLASHTARAACVLCDYGDPSFKASSELYSASVLDGSLLALVTNWSTQDQSQTAVFATVIPGGG